jgi:archaeosortase C (PEF-CTERM variant)
MTIFLGGALIVYNLIPEKYETEARFLVIFLGLFFISISLPLALLFLDVGSKAGAYYMRSFISDPLAGLLNLVGIRASTAYNWVYYRGKTDTIQLGMGISCSGAYSFAIFFSAFMAYVHIQYGKLNRKLLLLLTAGLAGTYLANLLRVFLIALIGFYYGTDALILAHRNFGWIIFMVWVTLFWYIGFKVFLEGKRLKVAFSSDEGDTQ